MRTAEATRMSMNAELVGAQDNGDGGVSKDESFGFQQTRSVLLMEAFERFDRIPHQLIVEHVLAMTTKGEAAHYGWSLREAAMTALIQRMQAMLKDKIEITTRPRRQRGRHLPLSLLGDYKTGRREDEWFTVLLPYTTRLESLFPFLGSCTCPDYVGSSLGLCQHLLCVLNEVFHRRDTRLLHACALTPTHDRLEWDPRLPLTGPIDRLRGLRLVMDPSDRDVIFGDAFDRDDRPREDVLADPNRRRSLLRAFDALPWIEGTSHIVRSPAALRVIDEEDARCARLATGAEDVAAMSDELATLRRSLYPHQLEGVRRILAQGRLLLADDMGLGKTTQAVAACHVLYKRKRITHGLVVVPASLRSQWLREWRATSPVPVEMAEGTPSERRATYDLVKKRGGFLIVGYEQLRRDLNTIVDLGIHAVILDEGQRIKNWTTKNAACVKKLTTHYRIALTGTPMENRIEELASILEWVDEVALGPMWRIKPVHIDSTGEGVGDVCRLDTLRLRMRGVTLRRTREQADIQLPPRTDMRVTVPMTGAQGIVHDRIGRRIAAIASRQRKGRPLPPEVFVELMQLLTQQRIVSNGLALIDYEDVWPQIQNEPPSPALLEELRSPKLVAFRSLLRDIVVGQQRKVVVFSQWRRMLKLAQLVTRDILEEIGARSVFFTGAERSERRTQNVVDFHDDPTVRVMFLTDAGGVGLNLQHAATVCINLELPWNPAVLEQRIGRIHRMGQRQPVDVFQIVNGAGIEARIEQLVMTKRALFEGVFEGTENTVRLNDGSTLLSQLDKLVDYTLLDDEGGEESDEVSSTPELPADVGGAPGGFPANSPQVPMVFARQLPPAPSSTEVSVAESADVTDVTDFTEPAEISEIPDIEGEAPPSDTRMRHLDEEVSCTSVDPLAPTTNVGTLVSEPHKTKGNSVHDRWAPLKCETESRWRAFSSTETCRGPERQPGLRKIVFDPATRQFRHLEGDGGKRHRSDGIA